MNDYYEKPYAGKSQVRFCEEHKLLTIIKYYKKWNVFTRLEAVLLEIIYLLLFALVAETIIVFALIILVIILSK